MTDRQRVELGLTSALSGVVVLSFGPIIIKDSQLEAIAFLSWRLWLATALTLLVLRLSGRRLNWRVLSHSWPGGLAFALNAAFFFSAVRRTSVANATVLGSLAPIVLLWAGNRFFGERVKAAEVAATAVSIVGVVLVVLGGEQNPDSDLVGDLMALAGMVLFAVYMSMSKQARQHLLTIEYQAGWTLVGAFVIVPIVLLSGQPLTTSDQRSWLLVGAMALAGSTGHWLVNFSHRSIALVAVSLLNLLTPVLSTAWAWAVFGETLVPLQFVGIAVVIASLGFVVLRTTAPGAGP